MKTLTEGSAQLLLELLTNVSIKIGSENSLQTHARYLKAGDELAEIVKSFQSEETPVEVPQETDTPQA